MTASPTKPFRDQGYHPMSIVSLDSDSHNHLVQATILYVCQSTRDLTGKYSHSLAKIIQSKVCWFALHPAYPTDPPNCLVLQESESKCAV